MPDRPAPIWPWAALLAALAILCGISAASVRAELVEWRPEVPYAD